MFEDKYASTLGVKVSRKILGMMADGNVVELSMMIWDLASNEEFDQVRASYLRGAAGAILVCDLTRVDTLKGLHTYADEVRQINPDAKFVVAANKQDLVNRQCVSEEALRGLAMELRAPYYLTSAKTGDMVETLFRHLGQLLVV